MGAGSWSASTYATTTRAKVASGTSFGYSMSVASGAASGVHEKLDPLHRAKSGPFAGKIVREARDYDDHPNSIGIAAAFDETGSMGYVPRLMQEKLGELFALLLRKGYVEDPQLLVGAYGDLEIGEQAPLQLGQFASDNRADDDLDNILLEGGGGGNGHESAAGVWWFLGRYAEMDCIDKRGKKGYLFTIGDETTGGITKGGYYGASKGYPEWYDGEKDATPEECAKLAQEKFNVYHIIINNTSARMQRSLEHYTKLLGKDNVIVLEDEAAVAETIALIIGTEEGMIDLDEGLDDIDEIGSNARDAVGKALATRGGGKGKVAVSQTPSDLVSASDSGASRL